jgi:hypothetical protein
MKLFTVIKRLLGMDQRFTELNAIIPNHYKHRVAIIDMLYFITASGTPVKNEEIETFLIGLAKEQNLSMAGLLSLMDDELENSLRQGVSTQTQIEILQACLK